MRDPLTGIYNRPSDERLASEFFARHNVHVSILLVDIDFFKTVNDTYGHQAGDAVLSVLARTLQRVVRTEDVVARYGGEEFVVVPRIRYDGAMVLADRIRKVVERVTVPWRASDLHHRQRGVASQPRPLGTRM